MATEPGPSSLLAHASTLRFPPSAWGAAQFRDVFNRLSAVETFNYTIHGESVELVTPPRESGEQLKISLGKDAVQVAFDPTAKSSEFVAEELMVVLKEVAAALPIPVFIHQSHVIRKTLPLLGGGDARTFLLNEVIKVPPERVAGWKRGFASVGVRFVFPPVQNELSAHDLKIESFLADPSKVFLEDAANFLVPMPAGQWVVLKANLTETNRFMDEYARTLLRGHLSPDT